GEGVEVTAAVDFDATTLESDGFSPTAAAPGAIIDATPIVTSTAARAASSPAHHTAALTAPRASATPNPHPASVSPGRPMSALSPHPATVSPGRPTTALSQHPATVSPGRPTAALSPHPATVSPGRPTTGPSPARPAAVSAAHPATAPTPNRSPAAPSPPRTPAALNPTALALTTRRASRTNPADAAASFRQVTAEPDATFQQVAAGAAAAVAPAPEPALSYDALASMEPAPSYDAGYDTDWISEAAREAVMAHAAPIAEPAFDDPVEEVREATLTPLASSEVKATFAEFQAPASPTPAATEAMGNELKTLRRMLETQLAHLAWNDLTRRAPVHTEILRELTEIGISQELAEHLVRQLPEDTELTFARRFTIAGISQYLKVTGDHWLDDGGRVAFAGATGVGKTTTLAKIAVRWVLRHGPRDIALIAADSMRIGAQEQLRSLAQMLGVPVYTPEKFEHLPSLLSGLNERLILIDTPGSSVRDAQLTSRLAVLSNSASKLETALVLAASTQAGSIEEAVKHFAPANPSCCVLTKIDEAASLGGVLSVLIRARLPVSYMSEGQRVPEDLRPARALELVSAAVRLAKVRGAAADEDLLRRRFGKTAHGIS
ncbi:MAG: flagellar biosynthesis protein FlhF, partial [Gammaproteobacteria bacterium]|nr:flagellar biosynthesis protein FlhF [Gammaproteobacteria bacterium]